MKNYRKIVLILSVFLAVSSTPYGFVNKNLFIANPPETDILGVWYLENSPENKIEFLNNGQMKLYEDNILKYTDTYSITNTCNNKTAQANNKFLRQIDGQNGIEYCFTIVNISADVLTLMTENGSVIVYERL